MTQMHASWVGGGALVHNGHSRYYWVHGVATTMGSPALVLIPLGVIIGIQGLAAKKVDGKVDKFHFDALGWVLGAVVLFGVLLRPAGLIVALIGLIVVVILAVVKPF